MWLQDMLIHDAAAAFHATEVLDVKTASEHQDEPLEDQGGKIQCTVLVTIQVISEGS